MFRRKRTANPPADPPGAGLRAMALALTPADIGVEPDNGQVWGFVMDSGMAGGGWYTVMFLADDTASLYTSAQFGVIGAGAHEAVRQAGHALLASAASRLELFGPDDDDRTPPPGQIVMRALTFDGRRSVAAAEAELGAGRHPAAAVFYAAHDVITAIREITPTE